MHAYPVLPLIRVSRHTSLPGPDYPEAVSSNLDDPALPLMTSLRHQARVTVLSNMQIDRALEDMARAGVRSAFVVSDGPGRPLIGHVSAGDIQGEKPMRFLQSVDCKHDTCSRDEVLVCHVMEPLEDWQVVDIATLRTARIGHVVATLNAISRRHLIVVDRSDMGGDPVVCGLFSATTLERRLGRTVEMRHAATSFAEIERELV